MYSVDYIIDLPYNYIKGLLDQQFDVKYSYLDLLSNSNLLDYKSKEIIKSNNFKKYIRMDDTMLMKEFKKQYSNISIGKRSEAIFLLLAKDKDLYLTDYNNININTVSLYDKVEVENMISCIDYSVWSDLETVVHSLNMYLQDRNTEHSLH